MSARPTAAELLERPDALLTRTALAELGLTRTMVDAVSCTAFSQLAAPLCMFRL